MIVGIGVDVIEIQRISDIIQQHGQRFTERVFTPYEQANAPATTNSALFYYAGRWSAKEAVAKALGTGLGQKCGWKDIEVSNCLSGRPVVTISGRGGETAAQLGVTRIHVTISHEKGLACASAVIEGDENLRDGDGSGNGEHETANVTQHIEN
ncbi:MAG: holo-ACP synthase [Verrucomicrobiota bacterium]